MGYLLNKQLPGARGKQSRLLSSVWRTGMRDLINVSFDSLLFKCVYKTLASRAKPPKYNSLQSWNRLSLLLFIKKPMQNFMHFLCPSPGRLRLHCTRGADLEAQAGSRPAAQGPASQLLHPAASSQHPSPSSAHKMRIPGPKVGGDPAHLFLNITVSKASFDIGKLEVLV